LNRSVMADLSLLMVAMVWGTTFVIVQGAIATLPPLTFNAIRFFIASLFLALFIIIFFREQLQAVTKRMVLSGVILGVWLFGGYGFQTVGLLYTTSSKAGFITGLSVVLVPIFTLLLLRQRLKWPSIFGVVFATIGLYLLTLGDSLVLNKGDILVFLCAISFALQITLTGKYAPHYPALVLALIQIFTVSILSSVGAVLTEDWTKGFDSGVLLQSNVLWALIITSILATAIAYVTQTVCQRFTTPTRVALIYAMEPVFAALAAFMWTEETLGVKAVLGCLLIFIGMIFAELNPSQFSLVRKKKSIASP
jgi:drug/metabolite transporter (DMT)-like permease